MRFSPAVSESKDKSRTEQGRPCVCNIQRLDWVAVSQGLRFLGVNGPDFRVQIGVQWVDRVHRPHLSSCRASWCLLLRSPTNQTTATGVFSKSFMLFSHLEHFQECPLTPRIKTQLLSPPRGPAWQISPQHLLLWAAACPATPPEPCFLKTFAHALPSPWQVSLPQKSPLSSPPTTPSLGLIP